MTAAVEARGLRKVFGTATAVDGIDLVVAPGTIHGLLGPNGAGKTTLVRMVSTLLRPTGGHARVFGHDVVRDADHVRARLGLTGQYAAVDEDLTGRENLQLVARLLGHTRRGARARADALLDAFGLAVAAARQVRRYSGGMRRRLDIAASVVVTPDLLVLDEPTTGLDPRSREHVWLAVRTLVAAGTTVLLTTQYLDEADRLADRITVLDEGRVVAEGTATELKDAVGTGSLHVRVADPRQRTAATRVLAAVLGGRIDDGPDPAVVRAGPTDVGGASAALAALHDADIAVADFAVGRPSLDEAFLALTDRTTTSAPA